VNKLDQRHTGRFKKERQIACEREGGEGRGGAKVYDGDKVWSSTNDSKLSVYPCILTNKPEQEEDHECEGEDNCEDGEKVGRLTR
jgi:hypothetical protein